MNAEELIFNNDARLHLESLLRSKLLERYILKTTISRRFISSNSHSVATIYEGWGAFK